MNGQMYQIALIVAAAKSALQTDNQIKYTYLNYEASISFRFVPQKKLFGEKIDIADNVSKWYEQLKKNELTDIKLLCPTSVKDRNLLGFSNTTESSMVCFFKNGKVTYFIPNWQFDSKQNKWNVLYTEHEWLNPPAGKPRFKNNSEAFRRILLEIRSFALEIGSKVFADVFSSAIAIFDSEIDKTDQKQSIDCLLMPEQNLRLFEAANIADVFGGMGSWNDEPASMAAEKGLTKEYNVLSDELLKNVRLAILYAINEW